MGHSHCLIADPFFVSAFQLCNVAIASAYMSLARDLFLLRNDNEFSGSFTVESWNYIRYGLIGFALFIFFCGSTHTMELLNMYWGGYLYILTLVISALCAVFSVWAAIMFHRLKAPFLKQLREGREAMNKLVEIRKEVLENEQLAEQYRKELLKIRGIS